MPNLLEISLLYVLAALVGAAISWFIRGLQQKTERRVLEELWMRKLRLSEQDQQKALQVMRQSTVEVKAHQRRVDEAAQLIESQDDQLVSLRDRMEARDQESRVREEEAAESRARSTRLESRDRRPERQALRVSGTARIHKIPPKTGQGRGYRAHEAAR